MGERGRLLPLFASRCHIEASKCFGTSRYIIIIKYRYRTTDNIMFERNHFSKKKHYIRRVIKSLQSGESVVESSSSPSIIKCRVAKFNIDLF